MNKLSSDSPRLKIFLNILVLLISLHGVSKKDLHSEKTTPFESFLIDTFGPVQEGLVNVKDNVSGLFDHYLFIIDADKENVFLHKRIKELEAVIFQLNEIKNENYRLKKLLEFGEEVPRKKVLAQIIGRDTSGHFRVLRINKGHLDGIKLKSTVVTYNGLVGHVYRTSDHYSDILTILDPNNRVDVIATRTRSHGILEGLSANSCIMKYVARTENILMNDNVITAGLGNIYPKGIHVGKIKRVEKESYGITQFIEVIPSVDFRKLEEVVVLVQPEENERWQEIQAHEVGNGNN